jgi:hypothetical protein
LKVLKTYEQYSGVDESDNINESVKELESLIGKELKFRTILYRDESITDDNQDFRRKKIRFGVIRQILDWDLYNEPMVVVECDDRTYRLTYDTKKDRFHIYRYYLPNKVVGVDPTDIEILEKFLLLLQKLEELLLYNLQEFQFFQVISFKELKQL